MNVCNLGVVTPLAVAALIFAIGAESTTGAVFLVVIGVTIVGVLANRFRRWRKRVAARKAGVARLLAAQSAGATGSREDVPTAAAAVVLTPLKFRETKAFTKTPTEAQVCTICFDTCLAAEIVNELPCGHVFHRPCLSAWTSLRSTCPTCRALVSGDDDAAVTAATRA